MHKRGVTVLTHTLLLIASAAAAIPLVGIVLIAFKEPRAPVGGLEIPDHLSFTNIVQTWVYGDFARSLSVTTVITAITVLIVTAVSVPAGYAFAKIRFPFKRGLLALFIFGLILPYASILIPTYYELRELNLTGTIWAVVLPSAALTTAFGTFWMQAVFSGLPPELVDAARVDGAGTFGAFWWVALPLARSGITVLMLLTAMWTWNAFMVPLVMLAGSDLKTGTMALATFQGGQVNNIPGVAASAVFISLPMVLLYMFAQRKFITGLTEAAVKG
jgi:raffinose/stachyose/melibiose transport system permease protein